MTIKELYEVAKLNGFVNAEVAFQGENGLIECKDAAYVSNMWCCDPTTGTTTVVKNKLILR